MNKAIPLWFRIRAAIQIEGDLLTILIPRMMGHLIRHYREARRKSYEQAEELYFTLLAIQGGARCLDRSPRSPSTNTRT